MGDPLCFVVVVFLQIRYQRLRKRTSSELPTEKVIERRTLQPLLYSHSPTDEIEFVTVLFCCGGKEEEEGEWEEGETSHNPLCIVKYVGVPSDFDSDEDEPRAALDMPGGIASPHAPASRGECCDGSHDPSPISSGGG